MSLRSRRPIPAWFRWGSPLVLLAVPPVLAMAAQERAVATQPGPAQPIAAEPTVGASPSSRRTLAPASQVVTHAAVALMRSPDLDGDGRVDGRDSDLLRACWGTSHTAADLDGNGHVDGADLGLLLGAWSPTLASDQEGHR